MIYIDDIKITPNPTEVGTKILIELELHEEYEGAKRYPYKYPYRYGGKGETE